MIPYVNIPGRGVHFLLQNMQNGSRVAKLCDFGGRREDDDADTFATAARELCEETGHAFGDESVIADGLRTSATVRILNRSGRYVCFFHKLPYCDAGALPEIDNSAGDDPVARSFRWWRADELLGYVDDSQLLERMMTGEPPWWHRDQKEESDWEEAD